MSSPDSLFGFNPFQNKTDWFKMIPYIDEKPPVWDNIPPDPFDFFDDSIFETAKGEIDFSEEIDLGRLLCDDMESFIDPEELASMVVLYDCKLSGCHPECAKTHRNDKYFDAIEFDPEEVHSYEEEIIEQKLVVVDPIYYTPNNDHSYYAPAIRLTIATTTPASSPPPPLTTATTTTILNDIDDKMDVLKNIPTPPSTSESPSETSSEDEVDVVTLPEEYQPPVVSKYRNIPRRSARTPRVPRTAPKHVKKIRTAPPAVKKPQRTAQPPLSAKSLKAAMRRTKIQTTCQTTYSRRKVTNSVETTPSTSSPSSTQSSDTDEVQKRSEHNTSERKRRLVQKTALENLRLCIPSLVGTPKAAKVSILNDATDLCKQLKETHESLIKSKQREFERRTILHAKLHYLRRLKC